MTHLNSLLRDSIGKQKHWNVLVFPVSVQENSLIIGII